MPLFKRKNKETTGKTAYPTQGAQGGYPAQPAALPPQYQGQPQQMAAPPQYAPPPYTAQPPTVYGGYGPGVQPYMQPQGQPSNVVVQGGFDAGARFDGTSQPNLPPPPPGVAPNMAQYASMQGQNVMVTQQKGNWLTGGSDGGYVLF